MGGLVSESIGKNSGPRVPILWGGGGKGIFVECSDSVLFLHVKSLIFLRL